MQLKQRWLTAAILIPVVVWCVLWLPTDGFAALFVAFVLLGAWEWSRLVPIAGPWARGVYVGLTLLTVAGVWWFGNSPERIRVVLWLTCSWWVVALIWIRCPAWGNTGGGLSRLGKGVAGLLTLVPAWYALSILHGSMTGGPMLVLCLLAVIWAADSGAFFIGRRWGHRRLAAGVSPGKTWEGVWGGLAAGGLLGLLAGWLLGRRGLQLTGFVLLCLITVSFSVVGDLLESLLKRQRNLKDSGRLLPGHGGILDRVDSLTASAPVFLLGIQWMGL